MWRFIMIMKKNTGFNNKLVLHKILTDPACGLLASSFYKTFLGMPLANTEIDEYADMTFVTKGAFSDVLEIIGEDTSGVKQLVRVRFIEMHHGLTSGYFDVTEHKWRDLRMHVQEKNFRYSYCQTIREVCFFYFNFSTNTDFFSVRKYDFKKLPKTVQFDNYELEKFKVDSSNQEITERTLWLDIFKNGLKSATEIPETLLVQQLRNVFDTDNWDREERKDYKDSQKHQAKRYSTMMEQYRKSGVELDEKYLNKPATDVDWNWLLLEKQLGQLPKNIVKVSDIDLSPLKADLPKLTFDLFRKWTKKCLEKHPYLDLTIVDEQILIKDVQKQMCESLISLFDNDTFYKRNKSKKYGLTYLLGHFEGALGVHWYMEYVIKTKDIFKTTMALRSLSLYLQIEDVMRLKVERIYEEVMRGKVNLSNPNLDIQKNDLAPRKGEITETNNSNSVVQTALSNLVNEYIEKISQIEIDNFDLNVSDFIDEMKVEEYIDKNWQLF